MNKIVANELINDEMKLNRREKIYTKDITKTEKKLHESKGNCWDAIYKNNL